MTPAYVTPARLAAALGHHLPAPGARIGLLGGSFNPAHDGHRQISLEALRRLGLDEVWWLVSPQNPLKDSDAMAPLAERLSAARRRARDPRIRVAWLESAIKTQYTADTITALRQRFPRVDFVWLMGADNLIQMTQWQDWPKIFHAVAIAVFDRPTYALKACAAKAARRFAGARIGESQAPSLARRSPPAWVFVHMRLTAASSTSIRTRGERSGRRHQ
jgi:nicotinate-nucleotide adenylyltransferase